MIAFLFWFSVAVLFLYPLITLLQHPLKLGTLSEFFDKLTQSTSIKKAVYQTLYFSSLVTIICSILGVFLGWLVTRTNLWLSNHFKEYLKFPYAIPPFIGAIAWISLANPTNGWLNHWLNTDIFNVYSMWGLILIETSFLYTFVFLAVTSALENMDPSLEEAARISGASSLEVFTKITWPLIRPSVWAGALIVFMACLASFGVPAMIGGPSQIRVLSTEIFFLQKMGTSSALQLSIFISGLLFIITSLLLIFLQLINKSKTLALVSGKTSRPSLVELKSFQFVLFSFVAAFLFCSLILPFIGMLLSALAQIQGEFTFQSATLNNFKRILFETEEVQRAFWNSIKMGLLAASTCVILSLLLAYFKTQSVKSRLLNYLEIVLAIPFSIPGTVLALALVVSFSQNFFGFSLSIYNTIYIFIYAFTLKYLNFSYKLIHENFLQIHPSLIEAARISGASALKTFFKIWLPLLKPSLLASFFLIFVPSISELTMSVLLTGPGLETLGTTIFQLQEYSDNHGGGAASLSVLIILFIILMNYLIFKLTSKEVRS